MPQNWDWEGGMLPWQRNLKSLMICENIFFQVSFKVPGRISHFCNVKLTSKLVLRSIFRKKNCWEFNDASDTSRSMSWKNFRDFRTDPYRTSHYYNCQFFPTAFQMFNFMKTITRSLIRRPIKVLKSCFCNRVHVCFNYCIKMCRKWISYYFP